MEDRPRLIERAFCLRQASIDSVHEKYVRHRHISTLHIWPARRPLAASRATIIATLLQDPETDEERKAILERLGGKVVLKRKKGNSDEKIIELTEGGILHWGRESLPNIEWFRKEIIKSFDGRVPRILDAFAGGGSIPFEAMRLGCEVTAVDINPVAWFLLKCTLDYPSRLTGQMVPLPKSILNSPDFMELFNKRLGKKGKKGKNTKGFQSYLDSAPVVDLSWHVRAWSYWVLQQASKELEQYYPVIDNKPTLAYLWARTVTCKNCRATIPLLKTKWLCKKKNKRILLTFSPNSVKNSVEFRIERDVPIVGNNTTERRAHDRKIGQGTMGTKGAWCPCCGKVGTISMTKEDIKADLKKQFDNDSVNDLLTVVIIKPEQGKDYRLPRNEEQIKSKMPIDEIFSVIPFGIPDEAIILDTKGSTWCVQYGADKWYKLYNPRQLIALGVFLKFTRELRQVLKKEGYNEIWVEAICAYLTLVFDRAANQCSNVSRWHNSGEKIEGTFSRYALPIVWDYAEVNPTSRSTGSYFNQINWVSKFLDHALSAMTPSSKCKIYSQSSIQSISGTYDAIVTDPPYYDAVSYSNIMDYFYVWIKRSIHGLSEEMDAIFKEPLTPKWDHNLNDGELVDDASRFNDDRILSKKNYEEGMYRVFQSCNNALKNNGRLVVVFAHKNPDAWEALVYGIIRAGFIVNGSWPIQTEMGTRMRARESAALSSSIWLVCKKRPKITKPGWDNKVIEEMREKIYTRLHEFWDAGIRGPDFVWAATGPALEAYSKFPVVKKANKPGEIMRITEFLRHVRRLVVDFVIRQVISEDESSVSLDDVTTYYLLHRHDFGLEKAPIGPCILYAISCGLSDRALTSDYDILVKTGGKEEEENDEIDSGTGSTVRLKKWNKRKNRDLGLNRGGRPAPIIDRIHYLMQLWRKGEPTMVDEYLEEYNLIHNTTFQKVLQATLELAKPGDEERNILEAISNHLNNKSGTVKKLKTLDEYNNKS